MGCLICGENATVKSHIVPRAIFHAMKREGRPFVSSRPSGPGYQTLQSGAWDNKILCHKHEAQLGKADAYGVDFCRTFKLQADNGATEILVANPLPDLLVDFASACVWRMAASRSGGQPEKWLGPYAQRLADSLFGSRRFDPLLLVSRHAFRVRRGQMLNMGALPYRYFEEGIRFWRFIVCGLIFDVKLDGRKTPFAMAPLAVNSATEITLFEDFPQDVLSTPGLSTSFRMMAASRGNGRRGDARK